MAKATSLSVPASGDPIGVFINNVAKNIKKGKKDKNSSHDKALNVSLGLRSIYRVLGDAKFLAEAKQAEKILR